MQGNVRWREARRRLRCASLVPHSFRVDETDANYDATRARHSHPARARNLRAHTHRAWRLSGRAEPGRAAHSRNSARRIAADLRVFRPSWHLDSSQRQPPTHSRRRKKTNAPILCLTNTISINAAFDGHYGHRRSFEREGAKAHPRTSKCTVVLAVERATRPNHKLTSMLRAISRHVATQPSAFSIHAHSGAPPPQGRKPEGV